MIKLFENFANVKEIKEVIFLKAVDTSDIYLIKFFLKKGYDINIDDALYKATYDDNTFRFFLKNKADVSVLDNNKLKELHVQKALIDSGYDSLIFDRVGFHNLLKQDPKYSNIVEDYENIGKFNL